MPRPPQHTRKIPHPGLARVACRRRRGPGAGENGLARRRDWLVVEEPLELRAGGVAAATLMRTPGNDLELALGFFFSEGWIASRRDVGAVAICNRRPAQNGGSRAREEENVADLLPPAGARRRFKARPRLTVASSCGVCGKRTIEEVLARTPLAAGTHAAVRSRGGAGRADWAVAASTLLRLPERLRREQKVFDRTGALHAAGLFDAAGRLLVVREDVGRHNAVDKVIGWALLRDLLPLAGHLLQVSGRMSFEIVEKAYLAGLSCVAGVSGVSSLALELALACGVTLVGFVRDGGFTVYAHGDRVVDDDRARGEEPRRRRQRGKGGKKGPRPAAAGTRGGKLGASRLFDTGHTRKSTPTGPAPAKIRVRS